MSALQQDLVVEGFPLGVISERHGELSHTGDEVLSHPLLVRLRPPHSVLQLITQETMTQQMYSCLFHAASGREEQTLDNWVNFNPRSHPVECSLPGRAEGPLGRRLALC